MKGGALHAIHTGFSECRDLFDQRNHAEHHSILLLRGNSGASILASTTVPIVTWRALDQGAPHDDSDDTRRQLSYPSTSSFAASQGLQSLDTITSDQFRTQLFVATSWLATSVSGSVCEQAETSGISGFRHRDNAMAPRQPTIEDFPANKVTLSITPRTYSVQASHSSISSNVG